MVDGKSVQILSDPSSNPVMQPPSLSLHEDGQSVLVKMVKGNSKDDIDVEVQCVRILAKSTRYYGTALSFLYTRF